MTKTHCLLLWEQVSTCLFWKTLVLRVSALRCLRLLCIPVTPGRKGMSIKGQGWILAKTLEFKQPKRISFSNYIGWVYINFRMLILRKTNRKFWFPSCLSSQFTNQTKLCSFSCSLVHSFCPSTNVCEDLLSADMVLLAKCLSIK